MRALTREASIRRLEKQWIQFFEDPGIWWDNRSKNWSPEFKHAITGEALFLASSPEWVREKISGLELPPSGSNKGFRARYRSLDKTASDFAAALKACSKSRDLNQGKELHREAQASKCHTDRFVAAALIAMYSKCDSMASAREVFDSAPRRDTVMWNTLILGYAENGELSEAMDLFSKMDCFKDSFTFVAALKACRCPDKGICIHREIEGNGLESNLMVATTLVDMYSRCGEMLRARDVFDRMPNRSVVTWNCLITAHVENGQMREALEVFRSMDLEPSAVTYVSALRACAGLSAREQGSEIHRALEDRGFDTDILVMTSVMDMYTKSGCMELALEVFSGLRCEPSAVTFLTALKAVTGLASGKESEKQRWLEKGVRIHKQLDERGMASDSSVANTLLDMYAKCGDMAKAGELFKTLKHRDAVAWTCLMLGYVANGESFKALELFLIMDCDPDSITYVAALQACGSLAALSVGRSIHGRALRLGLDQEQTLGNTLLDMYSKCSNMSRAEQTINSMSSPNVVSWNALLSGYSSLAHTERVLDLATFMLRTGVALNRVSFLCILTACSHAGMVDAGRRCFASMKPRHSVTPDIEHYTCVVDMLGRANQLEEAVALLQGVTSVEADCVAWRALLGACKKWRNPVIGKVAFDNLVARDRNDAAAYVLLREIYDALAMDAAAIGE